MKKRIQTLSLRTKAMLTVGCVPIIVVGVIFYQNFRQQIFDHTNMLHNLSESQTEALSHSIAQAMWDINTKAIHTTLLNAIKTPDVDKIIIRDDHGQILDSIWKPEWVGNHFKVTHSIVFDFAGEVKNLGEVEFYVSNARAIKAFKQSMMTSIAMSSAALLLQLIITWLMLNWLLTPIQKITQTMRRLSEGETELELPATERQDEIGEMAHAIETFRNTAIRAGDLEREVEIRTMLQKQLEIASTRAETANLAKSQFLATMSHEIRTPLNGVIATTELLAESELNHRQKKMVEIIHNSGELLLGLISDVLDLAKIEAGKVELHTEAVNIRHAFENTCCLFVAMADAKNLSYRYFIAPNMTTYAMVDVFRMRQVMSNFISNAIKYTESGGITIHFETVDHDYGRKLMFRVVDTGRGIPADSLDLVFDKFTQINRKDAIGGTGLGLPICQSIITMMGGEIGVESTVGQGSTFWFSVPLIEVSKADMQTERTLSHDGQMDHKGCKILVAEDVEVNQFVISEMLQSFGCTVELADNGLIALDKASKNDFDLILMDCSMPVMDGYAATRKIRASGDNKTPIIAVTAHTMSEGMQQCLDAGMNDFIAKPVSKRNLQQALDRWHPTETSSTVERIEASAPASDMAFDSSVLTDILGSIPSARALRMIELTLRDSGTLYEEVCAAFTSGDAEALADSAHALKSVSAQAGALQLSSLCKILEVSGKARILTGLDNTFTQFQSSYTESRKRILELQAHYTPLMQ